jgi:hypothetical protein
LGLLKRHAKADDKLRPLAPGLLRREFGYVGRIAKWTDVASLIRVGCHFAAAVLASEKLLGRQICFERRGCLRCGAGRPTGWAKPIQRLYWATACFARLSSWCRRIAVDQRGIEPRIRLDIRKFDFCFGHGTTGEEAV